MSLLTPFTEFALLRQSVGEGYNFPLGEWAAEGQVIGDATGGFVRFEHIFDRAYIYSWEGVSGDQSVGATGNFSITWFPRVTPSTVAWTLAGEVIVGPVSRHFLIRDSGLNLPVSAQNPRSTVVAQVHAGDNANTLIFTAKIWGHFWDKRAYLTVTGPIRPT